MEPLIRPHAVHGVTTSCSNRSPLSFAAYAFRLLFLGAICAASVSAQWVQTNGPGGGQVYAIYASGPRLLAGTFGGPYVSTNGGTYWMPVSSGIPNRFVYAFTGVSAGRSRLARH